MNKSEAIEILSLHQEFGNILDVSEEFNCDFMLMFEKHNGSIKYINERFYPENDGIWSIDGFDSIENAICFLKNNF